jgi:putative two-component system response regulator
MPHKPIDAPGEGWVARLWHEQADSDPFLHSHSEHVATVCAFVAREIGFDDAAVLRVQLAAQFHDIGKLDLPPEVLYAPRRLTPEERDLVQRHSLFGYERLHRLPPTPMLADVEEVALHHHERFDGTGYPDRMAGDAISLAARIASVGDVYAALWERRSYKPAMPHDAVLDAVTRGDGRTAPEMFDPNLLLALKSAMPQLRKALPD